MLRIQPFVFNPFQENTFVLFDETKKCIIIDPGCYEESEKEELASFIRQQELDVKFLLNTHCHIDHILGNSYVKEKYGVKLLISKLEEPVLMSVKVYAPNYGFMQYHEASPDAYLKEGDVVKFGNTNLNVIFVPGHSPGHIAFYDPENQVLIGGDVLFFNSIGRTDLPGGDYNTLINSIHQKLFTLPDQITVYPGHGPETTIGYEKRANPFCALSNVR
jgi:hydroxyacylglutathione hydrolase